MRTVTTREHQLLERILRRIDRKATFHARLREDGDIEVEVNSKRLSTTTRIRPEVLEASADDVLQFETLRGKIKRVYDRMHVPAPAPKMPKVEIQKDVAFGFRRRGRGGRR
jgi:hypothetical protein